MLREVIGALMAIFMGTLILWVILPTLKNVQNLVFDFIDTNDTATLQLMALGEALYFILGGVVFFVVGFILLSYASRRGTFDTG